MLRLLCFALAFTGFALIDAKVVFREDFNGAKLDKNNWTIEVSMYGGLNWEFQAYTNNDTNVYLKDGYLHLQPTLAIDDPRISEASLYQDKMDMTSYFGTCTHSEDYGCVRDGSYGILPPVWSGKVWSSQSIKFGTVEVRARIPTGDWLWPAIWMLPKSNAKYGIWPRSGEFDIMESRGNKGVHGVNTVSSTLHWGTDYKHNAFMQTTASKSSNKSWAEDFHTWKLDWTSDHIITSIDGEEILKVPKPVGGFWKKGGFNGTDIWAAGTDMSPFDEEFYILLNVAVGGTNNFFPDDEFPNKPWKNASPKAPQLFWAARDKWLPTWQGNKSALIIDYVEFKDMSS